MNIFKDTYLPKNIDETVYNKDVLRSLINLLSNPDHNNLIIYGPKNSGKNVILNLALDHLYHEHYNTCKTTTKNGILYKYSNIHYHFFFNLKNKYEDLLPIINEIINSKNHYIDVPNNLLIFDNFHNINSQLQESLKFIVERNFNIKIIILTNKLNKIIHQIRSRTTHIRVPILPESLINYAHYINSKESLELDDNNILDMCEDSNINNLLDDLNVYNITKISNEPIQSCEYTSINITLNTKILNIICKKKITQKNLDEIKSLAHTILISFDDISEYIKSLLQYLFIISQDNINLTHISNKSEKISKNINLKFKLILNDIKIYELIKLFSKIDISLLQSYRKIIFIESLIFNIHRILISS